MAIPIALCGNAGKTSLLKMVNWVLNHVQITFPPRMSCRPWRLGRARIAAPYVRSRT